MRKLKRSDVYSCDSYESLKSISKEMDKDKQSVKHTHIEVLSNQVIGILGGWLIVYFIFPLFEHLSQDKIATISTFIFFCWSYTRSYVIRRYFNNKL